MVGTEQVPLLPLVTVADVEPPRSGCLLFRPRPGKIREGRGPILAEQAPSAKIHGRDGSPPKCRAREVLAADTGDQPACLGDLVLVLGEEHEGRFPGDDPPKVGRQILTKLEVQGPGHVTGGVLPSLAQVHDPFGPADRIGKGSGLSWTTGSEDGTAGPLRFRGAMYR